MIDAGDSVAVAHGTRPDLSGWEDPPRVVRGDTAPVLSADGVEGPLDWLLEMARAKKLDLAKLSIAALIGQFADALATALAGRDTGRLDRWAGWTVIAATLTELWSRLLLPADAVAAKAAEAEAEALRRPQLGWDVFPRGRPEAGLGARGSDIADLLRACLVVLAVPEPPRRRRIAPGRRRSGGSPMRSRVSAGCSPPRPAAGRWRRSCRPSPAAIPRARCAAAPPLPAPWSPAWNSRAMAPSSSIRPPTGRRSESAGGRTARLARRKQPSRSVRPWQPDQWRAICRHGPTSRGIIVLPAGAGPRSATACPLRRTRPAAI
jgi:hypothetical protein